jgi:hypothetical protein
MRSYKCLICRKNFIEGEIAKMIKIEDCIIPIHYRCREREDYLKKLHELGKNPIINVDKMLN